MFSRGSHTVYTLHYHLIWVTKYRKPVLGSAIARKLVSLMRMIAEQQKVEVIKGHISKDHVHMFVAMPPDLPVSRFVQRVKGKSSHWLLRNYPELKREYWGRHFWARGYCALTSGNVTDEIIKNYIENHGKSEDDIFSIDP